MEIKPTQLDLILHNSFYTRLTRVEFELDRNINGDLESLFRKHIKNFPRLCVKIENRNSFNPIFKVDDSYDPLYISHEPQIPETIHKILEEKSIYIDLSETNKIKFVYYHILTDLNGFSKYISSVLQDKECKPCNVVETGEFEEIVNYVDVEKIEEKSKEMLKSFFNYESARRCKHFRLRFNKKYVNLIKKQCKRRVSSNDVVSAAICKMLYHKDVKITLNARQALGLASTCIGNVLSHYSSEISRLESSIAEIADDLNLQKIKLRKYISHSMSFPPVDVTEGIVLTSWCGMFDKGLVNHIVPFDTWEPSIEFLENDRNHYLMMVVIKDEIIVQMILTEEEETQLKSSEFEGIKIEEIDLVSRFN